MVTATQRVGVGDQDPGFTTEEQQPYLSPNPKRFAWNISLALWLSLGAFTAALLAGTDLELPSLIGLYAAIYVAYCLTLVLLHQISPQRSSVGVRRSWLKSDWLYYGTLAGLTLVAMLLSGTAVSSSSVEDHVAPAPQRVLSSAGLFSLTAGDQEVLKVAELGDSSLASRVHIYRVFNEGPGEIEVTHGNKALTRVPAGSSVDVDVGRSNYKLLVVKLSNRSVSARGSYEWVTAE
jgi:hypothetical protein